MSVAPSGITSRGRVRWSARAMSVALVVVVAACTVPRQPPGGGRPTTTTTTVPTTPTTVAPSTTSTVAPPTTEATTTTTSVPAPPDGEGTIRRLTDGDSASVLPAVSADGRYVAYYSSASNLVPDDTNGFMDVFVWDRATGTTTRITDGNGMSRLPSVSADGRYVAFDSMASNLVPDDTNGFMDVFVWDRATGTTTRITNGNDESGDAVISADGGSVTFDSQASNLVPDDTNGFKRDVFVWDADTGATTRITDSVWYTEEYSLSGGISADGRYVTFSSLSSTLVPDDTNNHWDVFVWDAVTGAITRPSDGAAFHARISSDGRFVTYNAMSGTDHVFVWDSTTGTTTRITDGSDGASLAPTISADGRHVTFQSGATNLVPGDTNGVWDVFVWDRLTGTIARITDGDGDSSNPAISSDGGSIAFWSEAGNLVAGDTNAVQDVFVWERAG
jgi:Tol biopolymer transport system component